mmetsp:Transcript_25444/g.64644  ORF Transcript_25444/g.64644 Transcript_25444/m.64644 type:complete len:291 (-) Transcript_25444:61-933(-)
MATPYVESMPVRPPQRTKSHLWSLPWLPCWGNGFISSFCGRTFCDTLGAPIWVTPCGSAPCGQSLTGNGLSMLCGLRMLITPSWVASARRRLAGGSLSCPGRPYWPRRTPTQPRSLSSLRAPPGFPLYISPPRLPCVMRSSPPSSPLPRRGPRIPPLIGGPNTLCVSAAWLSATMRSRRARRRLQEFPVHLENASAGTTLARSDGSTITGNPSDLCQGFRPGGARHVLAGAAPEPPPCSPWGAYRGGASGGRFYVSLRWIAVAPLFTVSFLLFVSSGGAGVLAPHCRLVH